MAQDLYSALAEATSGSEDADKRRARAMAAALRGESTIADIGAISGAPAAKQLSEGLAGRLKQAFEIASQRRQERALEAQIGQQQYEREHQGRVFQAEQEQRGISNARAAEEQRLSRARFGNELGQQLQQHVQALGTDLAPHAEFYRNFNDAEKIIGEAKKKGEGLPGVGMVKGLMPDWITSNEGIALRERVAQMALQFDRATGGARSLNPAMLGKYQEATALTRTANPRSMLQGMGILKQLMDADAQAKAAKYPAAAREEYFRRGPGLPLPGNRPPETASVVTPQQQGPAPGIIRAGGLQKTNVDLIPVLGPDGKLHHVHHSKLQEAIQRGGRQLEEANGQ